MTGSFSSIHRTILAQIGLSPSSHPRIPHGRPGLPRPFRHGPRLAWLAAALGCAAPALGAPAEPVLPGIAPQLPGAFRLAPDLGLARPVAVQTPAPRDGDTLAAPSVCPLPEDCLGPPMAVRRLALAGDDPARQGALYGPPETGAGVDAAGGAAPEDRYRSFGSQLGAIKWEMGAILAYYTAINGPKLLDDPTWPHFHREGWFGESTRNVGMDKLAHSYSAYVIADLLYARLKRKTDNAPGIALTAAALASATMLYTEFWDSIEKSAGWSWEDVAFNSLGSGFSLLHNSVPGLDRKLDFRLMIVPNSSFLNVEGKRHFEQQRYFFALKFAGFEAFENSPLRLLELHLGYYGRNFTNEDRAMGIRPDRRVFVGVGINLRELFFRDSHSRIGRAAGEVLDYFQPPYTAIQMHVTN